MAIEELVALIPPPEKPIDGEGDWSVAEKEFGIVFPSDFKQLIQRYGTGQFYDSLLVANPLSQWGLGQLRESLRGEREFRDACELPLKIFPESPGLLPWGSDSNGHVYCWWCEGPPDLWSMSLLIHNFEEDFKILPGPITNFLVRFFLNDYSDLMGGTLFSKEKYYFKKQLPWLR